MVVQLVRIPACHAGGRGFESRPLRQDSSLVRNVSRGFSLFNAIFRLENPTYKSSLINKFSIIQTDKLILFSFSIFSIRRLLVINPK